MKILSFVKSIFQFIYFEWVLQIAIWATFYSIAALCYITAPKPFLAFFGYDYIHAYSYNIVVFLYNGKIWFRVVLLLVTLTLQYFIYLDFKKMIIKVKRTNKKSSDINN